MVHFASHCLLQEEVVAFESKRGARTEEKTEKRSRKSEKSEEKSEEEELHLSEEEKEAAKSQPRRRKVGVWSSHESQHGLFLLAEPFGLLGRSKRRR